MSAVRAVVLADTEGRTVSWDAGAEALFGHTASEAVGRSLRAAGDAEPAGGEELWGTVLPLPEREEAS